MITQQKLYLPRVFPGVAIIRLNHRIKHLARYNDCLHLYFSENLPCLPNDLNSTAVLTNKTTF